MPIIYVSRSCPNYFCGIVNSDCSSKLESTTSKFTWIRIVKTTCGHCAHKPTLKDDIYHHE